MRRTFLSPLLLALVAIACSDSAPATRLAEIEELRVVAVSGDQTSQVSGVIPTQTIYATAGGLSTAAVGDDGYTDVPLVARVEAVRPRGWGGMSPSGSLIIPDSTVIYWGYPILVGHLQSGSNVIDDSAHVINRWTPGTTAGTFIVEAGRSVGDSIVFDAEWVLIVEPGPMAVVHPVQTPEPRYSVGDTIDARSLIDFGEDAFGNRIDADAIGKLPDSKVTWTISESESGSTAPEFGGTGWEIVIPTLDGFTLNDPGDGDPRYYRLRVHIAVEGAETSDFAYLRVQVDEPE